MKLVTILDELEKLAPSALQESYDNAGLLTGHRDMEITRALVCLDSTEAVIDEAIAKGCQLVIAHHPIVFKGLKRFNGKTYVERVIIKCIKNDIALYAVHTNLDNVRQGVNEEIADVLGLHDRRILIPKEGMLDKIETYLPASALATVMKAMWIAGAGKIGQYGECSYRVEGKGTFLPLDGASPTTGLIGTRSEEEEIKLEMILPDHASKKVLAALIKAHPYEQVAYQLIALKNQNQEIGAGIIGSLEEPMKTIDFLKQLKKSMEVGCVRHTAIVKESVQRIAVLGGSGSFGIKPAIGAGADVLVTADVKYHEFFEADGHMVVASIGHYESEHFTSRLLQRFLSEKLPTFAVLLTEQDTNPVNYL